MAKNNYAASTPHLVTKADYEHMAAIKAGSQTSWGKLYERHQSALVRFCGNFTADPQLAEDWAQEAFVRLKENAHTFKHGAELKPWLYKVARNIYLEHRRKRRQSHEVQWSDSVFATHAIRLADAGHSPASKGVADELNADAKNLLASLNEEMRTVFILKYVEDLSRKEIAEIMDVPEAIVKSRLYHAMNALQERLKGSG